MKWMNFLKVYTELTGKTAITNRTCVSCGAEEITENSFREDVALREFHISKFCQVCQDKIFGIEEQN